MSEILDKLYLELSNITEAKSAKELKLTAQLAIAVGTLTVIADDYDVTGVSTARYRASEALKKIQGGKE